MHSGLRGIKRVGEPADDAIVAAEKAEGAIGLDWRLRGSASPTPLALMRLARPR